MIYYCTCRDLKEPYFYIYKKKLFDKKIPYRGEHCQILDNCQGNNIDLDPITNLGLTQISSLNLDLRSNSALQNQLVR